MELKVDYHIHTNCSDGELTPTQVVKKFKKEEYDVKAITDHVGVDGIKEAKIAGAAIEEWRRDRNKVIIKKLNDLGYHVDIDEIYKAKGNDYIGKPDIARYLLDKGMIAKMDDAFSSESGI